MASQPSLRPLSYPELHPDRRWLLDDIERLARLYRAQKQEKLATEGIYSYVRHPQYDGFILVMLGFLFQWPTVLTLAMFPVLVVMYVRLARSEEREALAAFGQDYRAYMARVPGFIPKLSRSRSGDPNLPKSRPRRPF